MPSAPHAPRNWFDCGGRAYARFRPEYPPELARYLAHASPSRELAVDIGCGSGQFSTRLADEFAEVIACDASADQLASAPVRADLRYIRASAEAVPLPDRCASLVSAAQAAHWFDLPAFYAEAVRIARRDALIALVSYGVPRLEEGLQARLDRFYHEEIGPWWPSERKRVDNGYRDMPFPFIELEAPPFEIRASWRLDDFLGYVSTWSAVKRLRETGNDGVIAGFANELAVLWGEPATVRPISWPISMRLGTVVHLQAAE